MVTNQTRKGFQSLTLNLLPLSCRVDTLEGKNYTVVPAIILTEGVHNGSGGNLYYAPKELSKTPEVWDHKPVVVYHPSMNGNAISACKPEVINSSKVGIMLNTTWSSGRLKTEVWIDSEKADKVDVRIMERINNNEVMELSTGLFLDTDPTPGEWNGETYTGLAVNFRPDHLALLPDQVGACSLRDGAGLLRNTENRTSYDQDLRALYKKHGLFTNEMSFDNIRTSITDALRKKYNVDNSVPNGPWLWVEAVYSNFAIFEWDGKLLRIGYTASDTGVSLSEEKAVEVKRVTEFRTVEGAFVGNQNQPENKTMKKKELIDSIITSNRGWAETDRKALEAFSEAQLTTINIAPPKPADPVPAPVVPTPVPATNTPAVPVTATPATPKIVTMEEYLATVPENLRGFIREGMDMQAQERTRLIGTITANKRNLFKPEQLNAMPISDLRAIATFAAGEEAHVHVMPNYGGLAPVPATNAEEALPLPVLNFSK